VVYLDLDGFKSVNDRYGHSAGDELLVAVSRRMKLTLRDGDTLARIGGDEFVAVLSEIERPEDCQIALDRLLSAAATPLAAGAHTLQVSASIGVTLFPEDGADADLLLRHADQAMYTAKQGGKNRYHYFDVAQDAAVSARRLHIDHLRSALDRREFVLFYQPKVNMRQGVVIGVEALIRWQHPERGLLPPAEFLPFIEGHSLSLDLGDWVIETVLAQMEAWRQSGPPIPISINIGAMTLQQSDFAVRLRERLAAYPEISPGWLELEILETSALEDMATVSYLLDACSAFGVSSALDDFGTGYSSLAYLRRLPIESLKIDQSFVRGMLDDQDDRLIVEGVIGLARAFQRRVIAEGVETVAHGAALLAMGCDLAQGYGVARPMPADKVQDWVRAWRPDPSWGDNL
jgi:diguanylate cyclase (GGDEF)-like protein